MGSSPETLLSVFDRIYVINLAHRADRRREMEAELNGIGLSLDHPAVTLFPASFPADEGSFSSRGARGCFESHLGVHRAILEDGVQRALMLEDDASFVPDFAPILAAIGDDLERIDWDMLYSVAPLDPQPGDQAVGQHLLALSPEHRFAQAHFVGFSHRFSERAVPYLEAMRARPPGDPQGGPMHVDGAYCWMRAAYPEMTVLGGRQPLAVQRPSRSDIADLRFWDRWPVLRQAAAGLRRWPVLRQMRDRVRRR